MAAASRSGQAIRGRGCWGTSGFEFCFSLMGLVLGPALGWPDETFPANAVVPERKSVDEAARFVGF